MYGGSFAIYRYQSAVAWAQAFGLGDRWSAGNVDGIPAAILAPILPEIGYGNSAIAFFSDGIMTRVTADGLPLKQVYQIAEGLSPDDAPVQRFSLAPAVVMGTEQGAGGGRRRRDWRLCWLAFPREIFSGRSREPPYPVALRVHPGASGALHVQVARSLLCLSRPPNAWDRAWTGTIPAQILRYTGGRSGRGETVSGLRVHLGAGPDPEHDGNVQRSLSAGDRCIAFSFPKGSIRYTHSGTWIPGWAFDINASAPIYGAWTQVAVGFSKWPEIGGCVAYAQHLHEDSTAQWTRNTAVYPSVVCYAGDPCSPPAPPNNDGEGTVYPNYLNGGQEQYSQQWAW